MTGTDLIVLIAWAIASVALILVCVRLQISSARARRPAGPAQPPGLKPAEAQDPAPPDGGPAPDAAPPDPVPTGRGAA